MERVERAAPVEDDASGGAAVRLRLLRGFELLVDGLAVDLPISAQRLVANLALHDRPRTRSAVASSLWIDLPDQRAAANLRTALWRLRRVGERVVALRGNHLSLDPRVDVDLIVAERGARELIEQFRPGHDHSRRTIVDDGVVTLDSLSGDLLPDWDEDWILFERERLRQLRLHALEALSESFRLAGRYADAVEAGMSAVSADPLRETAHRALIEAYLAEGNVADAKRQLEHFRTVLWDSLAISPSSDLVQRVSEPAAPVCRCYAAVPVSG